MKRTPDKMAGRLALVAALSALALSAGDACAQAQTPGSVQEYSLPPAPTPTATAAGPVDSDHPVAAPTTATPAPRPAPAPPVIAPAAPTSAAPPPRQSAAPAAPATAAPRVQEQPAAEPAATPTAPAPPVSALPPAMPAPAAIEPAPSGSAAPSPPAGPQHVGLTWLWIALGAGLVLLLGALLRRRRRTGAEPQVYEPDVNLEPAPSPPAEPKLARREAAPVPLPPVPTQPAPALRPLEMELEARHLSRAMINATLSYRLTLTNRSDAATGPLRIAGDIVSAHASLSAEEQLAPRDSALETIHQAPALDPGESVTLSGELRMPIASILPIQSGGARVFVPLARFRAETEASATTRIFVIGQTSEQPGGALRPFPLDRGPGVDRGLGQRELEIPA